MNRIVADYCAIFSLYQALRDQLLDEITDDDLAFRPYGRGAGQVRGAVDASSHAFLQSR